MAGKGKKKAAHKNQHLFAEYDPALYANEQLKLATEILGSDDGTLAPAVVRICEKMMADADQDLRHKQEHPDAQDDDGPSAAASEARTITELVREQYPSAKLTEEQLLAHLERLQKLQDRKAQTKSAKRKNS